MCGIVGTATRRDSANILIEGLCRLEYRGYDSAGFAVLDDQGKLQRERRVGKVQMLKTAQAESGLDGKIGIAHTRWATHGKPTELNAHPHASSDKVAVASPLYCGLVFYVCEGLQHGNVLRCQGNALAARRVGALKSISARVYLCLSPFDIAAH